MHSSVDNANECINSIAFYNVGFSILCSTSILWVAWRTISEIKSLCKRPYSLPETTKIPILFSANNKLKCEDLVSLFHRFYLSHKLPLKAQFKSNSMTDTMSNINISNFQIDTIIVCKSTLSISSFWINQFVKYILQSSFDLKHLCSIFLVTEWQHELNLLWPLQNMHIPIEKLPHCLDSTKHVQFVINHSYVVTRNFRQQQLWSLGSFGCSCWVGIALISSVFNRANCFTFTSL